MICDGRGSAETKWLVNLFILLRILRCISWQETSVKNIQFCRQSRGSICELIDDFNECCDEGYINGAYRDGLKRDAYTLIKVLHPVKYTV